MHFYIIIDLFIHSVVLSHSLLAVCGQLQTTHPIYTERESFLMWKYQKMWYNRFVGFLVLFLICQTTTEKSKVKTYKELWLN